MKFKPNQLIHHHEVSIISSTMEVVGNIITDGNLRVDGKIKGDVKASGVITVGSHGQIMGNVSAKKLTNGGKILGSVSCAEKLLLEEKSELHGDLIAQILVVEEGAFFKGNSNMHKKIEEK